jgi:hypothetical protein
MHQNSMLEPGPYTGIQRQVKCHESLKANDTNLPFRHIARCDDASRVCKAVSAFNDASLAEGFDGGMIASPQWRRIIKNKWQTPKGMSYRGQLNKTGAGRMEMSLLSHREGQNPWEIVKNEDDPGSNPYPGGFAETSKLSRPSPNKLFYNKVHTETMHEKNLHVSTLNSFECVQAARIVANEEQSVVSSPQLSFKVSTLSTPYNEKVTMRKRAQNSEMRHIENDKPHITVLENDIPIQ